MPGYTTDAIGEEDLIVTSDAIGEEEQHTTDAVGEEDPSTTIALGEEGAYEQSGSTPNPFGAF